MMNWDRYQRREKLGNGGNGQVYRVWDLHLEKEWAMKILQNDAKRELTLLKQLSHRRFPRVVDAYTDAEQTFLIMDYLPGITLEELIQKEPMDEELILKIAKQIGEGLRYLHEYQPTLLYLDLKPSNILVDEEGEVRLVDLGSMMIKGEGDQISGTFGFASPEQICAQNGGRDLTEQSDIFSFGMVLFSMVCGNTSRFPVVERGQKQGIYTSRYYPLVSSKLEAVIEICTRGIPEKRYLHVDDLCRSLERIEKGLEQKKRSLLPISSLPVFRSRRRTFWEKEWQQEKSVICTQGKKKGYLFLRSLAALLLVLGGAGLGIFWEETFWGHYSLAKEAAGKGEYTAMGKAGEEQEREGQKLPVTILDSWGRKVLVKEGASYQTKENLLFSLSWEDIGQQKCRITIICEEKEENPRIFQLDCTKK